MFVIAINPQQGIRCCAKVADLVGFVLFCPALLSFRPQGEISPPWCKGIDWFRIKNSKPTVQCSKSKLSL